MSLWFYDSVPLYSLLWFYGGYLQKFSLAFFNLPFFFVDWLVDFKAPYVLGICYCYWFIHLGFGGIWGVCGFGVCGFLVGWFVFLVLFFVLYFACLFVSRVLNMFLYFYDSSFSILWFFGRSFHPDNIPLWVCYEGRCFFSRLCFWVEVLTQSGRVHRVVSCNSVLVHDECVLHLLSELQYNLKSG